MISQRRRTAALADIMNLLLGMLLFLAPWLFGFVSNLASGNAWLSGALIGLVAIAAILALDTGEERLNLIMGPWVAASPWLLGFHAERHIHVLVGLLVAGIAAIEIGWTYRACGAAGRRSRLCDTRPNRSTKSNSSAGLASP